MSSFYGVNTGHGVCHYSASHAYSPNEGSGVAPSSPTGIDSLALSPSKTKKQHKTISDLASSLMRFYFKNALRENPRTPIQTSFREMGEEKNARIQKFTDELTRFTNNPDNSLDAAACLEILAKKTLSIKGSTRSFAKIAQQNQDIVKKTANTFFNLLNLAKEAYGCIEKMQTSALVSSKQRKSAESELSIILTALGCEIAQLQHEISAVGLNSLEPFTELLCQNQKKLDSKFISVLQEN